MAGNRSRLIGAFGRAARFRSASIPGNVFRVQMSAETMSHGVIRARARVAVGITGVIAACLSFGERG